MTAANPNQLLAEDEDLKGFAIALMKRSIAGWPITGGEGAPVYVRRGDSAEQSLRMLPTLWKLPDLKALGIVIDADDQFDGRWTRIKEFAKSRFRSQRCSRPVRYTSHRLRQPSLCRPSAEARLRA